MTAPMNEKHSGKKTILQPCSTAFETSERHDAKFASTLLTEVICTVPRRAQCLQLPETPSCDRRGRIPEPYRHGRVAPLLSQLRSFLCNTWCVLSSLPVLSSYQPGVPMEGPSSPPVGTPRCGPEGAGVALGRRCQWRCLRALSRAGARPLSHGSSRVPRRPASALIPF